MPENSTNRGYPLPVAGDAFTPQGGVNALGVAVDADVQALADDVADASGIDNGAIGPAKLDRAYAESGNHDVRIGVQAGLSIGDAYSQVVAIGAAAMRDVEGVSSVAIGYQSQMEASGSHSTAVGHQTQRTASGVSSVAVGRSAQETASGDYAVALGPMAQRSASGGSGVAVGFRSQQLASGVMSSALGAESQYYVDLVVNGSEMSGPLLAGRGYFLLGTDVQIDGVPFNDLYYVGTGSETLIAASAGTLTVQLEAVDADYHTVVGAQALADHPGGIALGYNAYADTDRQVQVGTAVTLDGIAPPNALRVGVHDAILTTDTPTTGEVLRFDGSAWVADGAATAAQGALADSAVQPGDLATVATTGAYGDLSGTPTLGTAAGQNVEAFATAAQGVKADAAAPAATIGNLLTANVATGTDTAGDTSGFVAVNATLSSSEASAWQGDRSLLVTATDAVVSVFAGTSSASLSQTPVSAGETYTFIAWVRSAAATRQVVARINWRQADESTNSTITPAVQGSGVFLAPGWQQVTVTGVCPADAAVASVQLVRGTEFTAGETFYTDGWTFHRGAGGTWKQPGVVIDDANTRVKPSDASIVQLWNKSTSSWVDAAASSSVVFGTTAGTATEGNDSRVVNAVQNTRQVATGSGLTGGGDLTADRTLAVDFTAVATAAQGAAAEKVEIGVACSDETTDLATGTAKVTFRLPHALTLTGVRASVTTAPVGSALTVDINAGGASVLSTLLTIDAGEKTSTTAATPAVIGTSALADDAEITVDIDAVGSSTAGAGLKVWLIGTRA